MRIGRQISFLFLVLSVGTTAWGQLFPVTANMQLNSPSTTYLTELTALGSDQLSVSLFFNDFRESFYDIRLQLSIEGNGISLVTSPNFVPPPLRIYPGANGLTGSDLADYLNPNNMLINGIAPATLQAGGSGLPEGIYTFCVQVFDYRRPEVALSINSCAPKLLRKNYPPNLVFPACGSTITVTGQIQDILFQWQSNTDLSIQTIYELSIVEVPPGMNPDDAMNGTGTKILDAEPVMSTSFLYGPDQLPLEVGKRYAYRIRATDAFGATTFENMGLSPTCNFYYGVDANGTVPLVSPVFDELVSTTQQLSFQWQRPLNALPSQRVYYKLKVVRLLPGQDAYTALEYNPTWYEMTTPVLPGDGAEVLPLTLYPLPAEDRYAWEVQAFVDDNGLEQEIAGSEKRPFQSAPAVEWFKFGNPDPEIITVRSLTKNEDLGNNQKRISGVGRMQIKESGEEVELNFTDLIVGPYQDAWQLESGSIRQPVSNLLVHLDNSGNPSGDPGNRDNYGRADFVATHVIVEKDDLKLQGKVRWRFPHAAVGSMPVLESAATTIVYNRYLLIDRDVAIVGNTFRLLDPYGFDINYYASSASVSKLILIDNILTLDLSGEVRPPAAITDTNGNRLAYRFEHADNPYYFTQAGMEADRDVRLVNNTQIQLDAITAIFDLSEEESPAKITDNTWKGVYFDQFNVRFPIAFDGSNQLSMVLDESYPYSALPDNDFYAWIDSYGVDCNVNRIYADDLGAEARFNTFAGRIREVQIRLEDQVVDSCFINGFVYIPLLSIQEKFSYTVPFDNNGLQVSFLDEDLVNKVTTIRANSDELRLNITVKQAVFRDNERLDLVIDLDWEAIQVFIPNLTGFKIWGNGETGFDEPGGAKGITNIVGRFDNAYEITVDSVAAGFFAGTYAFNFISSILLGDEKVGMTGESLNSPPKSQFYTDEKRIPPGQGGPPPPITTANYLGADHWTQYNNGTGEELLKGEMVLFIPFMFWYPIKKPMGGTAAVRGFVMYTKGDPTWGNVFLGMAQVEIMKPVKYGVSAKLIMGKKQKVNYGLFEMRYTGNNIDYLRLGRVIGGVKAAASALSSLVMPAKEASSGSALTQTIQDKKIIIGSYNVVEIGGRFYWNMSHDVEAECGDDYTSLLQVGTTEDQEFGTSAITTALTGNFTDKQIIDAFTPAKLLEMLCELRANDRESFRVVLNGLPAPDFNYLATALPQIPQSLWNQLAAANVDSYSHLELLFPDDWCPNIMNAVIGAAEAAWAAAHQAFGDPPGWSDHLTSLIQKPDFGNFGTMTEYYQTRTLLEIQLVQPATASFFIDNNILTEAEWNLMTPINGGPITWLSIYESYPEKNWGQIIPSLIDLDWATIWGAWLPESPRLEIGDIVAKYAPSAWDKLKETYSDVFSNIILPGLNSIAAGNPSIFTNYRVDNSIDFGLMLSVRAEDLATGGMTHMMKGTLEMSFGQGALGQFLLRVEAGWGNRLHPSDTEGSLAKGQACITYTEATRTFIADLQAQAIAAVGPGGFCGQGMLHFESSPGEIHMEIGNRNFPIVVGPCGVTGLAALLGWVEIHDTPDYSMVGLGIGKAQTVYLQTPRFGSDACSIYGYLNAFAAFAAFGEITIPDQGGVSGEVGVLIGAGVDIGVNFSGFFCPFGNLSALYIYLGGELVFALPSGDGHLSASGTVTVFGSLNLNFKFNQDFAL